MVTFEGVAKRYGEGASAFAALNGVDLSVGRGEITGIIGRSGAGKSTLIRLVNGLEKANSGEVVVDGIEVGGLNEAALRGLRREVGMIFQHFNLLSSRTVFDNVALPLEIAGLDRTAIRTKVDPLLDLVGLGAKVQRYSSELSGRGEAARRHRQGPGDVAETAALRRGDLGTRPGNDAVDPGAAEADQCGTQPDGPADHP